MSLVERVARVIDACDHDRVDHELCIRQARAAISEVLDALMEPSEGMVEAYFDRCDLGGDLMGSPDDPRHPMFAAWQAMLAQFRREVDEG